VSSRARSHARETFLSEGVLAGFSTVSACVAIMEAAAMNVLRAR
jgi:hypothetical protein